MPRCNRRALLEAIGLTAGSWLGGCTGSPGASTPRTDESSKGGGHRIAGTAATSIPPLSTALAAAGTNYPMFQFDAGNTGQTDGTGPVDAGEIAWQFDLGTADLTMSDPVVAGDVVYVATAQGSRRNQPTRAQLHALHARSGERYWSREIGESVRVGHPAVIDDSVMLTIGTVLTGINGLTGEPDWVAEPLSGAWGPAISGEMVVNAGGPTVFAVDRDDGSTRWQYRPAEFGGFRNVQPPAIADSSVYAAAASLDAVNRTDGHRSWSTSLPGAATGAPTVSDETIYIGTRPGWLVALDSDEGTVKWRRALSTTALEGSVAVGDGIVCAASHGRLFGLDPTDGATLWDREERLAGPPVLAGETAYVRAASALVAIDITTGTERWRLDALGPRVGDGPAVANGRAVTVANNSRLLAVEST